MRIVKLQASNVKRLVAVEIQPKGDVVEIRGKNGAGKSSVLDAIAYALGGTKLCPAEPMRQGQARGEVTVELEGGLIVTRTWTKKGSYLEVTINGEKKKSPQAILDELAGRLTFDPLAFTRLEADKQRAQLIELLGIGDELAKLDAEVERVYANRTEWNREVDRFKAAIQEEGSIPPNTPDAPIGLAQVTAELEAALETTSENEKRRENLIHLERLVNERKAQRDKLDMEETELMRKLDAVRKSIMTTKAAIAEDKENLESERKAVAALVDPDVAPIKAKMANLEQTNEAVRCKIKVKDLRAKLDDAQQQADAHTQILDELKADKAAVLAAAEYPVEGLGFDGDGVTYNGVPFAQCSAGERLRVSTAIAMRLNPKLRVILIRDGSLLDDASLDAIQAAAAQDGYQVWLERVADEGKAGAILIEDGEVIEDRQGE
jgi:DNA repair exonuclease SbcCD ATPase subunit